MGNPKRKHSGVTLVELVVAIAVLAIIVTLALPSFRDFAERRAIKGLADGLAGAVGMAKEEAIKQDRPVRIDFRALGDGVCVGANLASEAECDCSTEVCSIATYPAEERDLRMVQLVGAPSFDGDGAFVVDPKTGMLADVADAGGTVELSTPLGYGLEVSVNAMARVRMCSSGSKELSGVKPC